MAEHGITDAFKPWCWRRLLRVSWIAKRSNQSILKEINPEYSMAGLMLKLKFQYFGHLIQTTDSLEKTLMMGKSEGRKSGGRGWDVWMASPIQWTWTWANYGKWWGTGKPGRLQSMRSQKHSHDLATEQQQRYYDTIHQLELIYILRIFHSKIQNACFVSSAMEYSLGEITSQG